MVFSDFISPTRRASSTRQPTVTFTRKTRRAAGIQGRSQSPSSRSVPKKGSLLRLWCVKSKAKQLTRPKPKLKIGRGAPIANRKMELPCSLYLSLILWRSLQDLREIFARSLRGNFCEAAASILRSACFAQGFQIDGVNLRPFLSEKAKRPQALGNTMTPKTNRLCPMANSHASRRIK